MSYSFIMFHIESHCSINRTFFSQRDAVTEFQKNKWKYASIGLAAILALVITTPTAMALSPTLADVMAKLTGVDTKVTNINTKVNTNLDASVSSRASQTSVNALPSKIYGSQVIGKAVQFDSLGTSVTSDRDYTVCYVLQSPSVETSITKLEIIIGQNGQASSNLFFIHGGRQTDSACLGADAGGTIAFSKISGDTAFGFITLTASEDATAGITRFSEGLP